MTKRTEKVMEAQAILEKFYNASDIHGYTNTLIEFLQCLSHWQVVDAKPLASVSFSNLLQSLTVFSTQHVQGGLEPHQSAQKLKIEQALIDYANYCFPPGS